MVQLVKIASAIIILLLLFSIWGHSVSQWLKIKVSHLAMQVLLGCFFFFIVMELVLLPVIFLHNDFDFAVVLSLSVVGVLTIIMLVQHRMGFLRTVMEIRPSIIMVVAFLIMITMTALAVVQNYLGYDTTYYVGEMASFIYYKEFWTRDAFEGLEAASEIPLHYALSAFYPLFSIVAYIFRLSARVTAMFVTRAICVILFGATAFTWGYELFDKNKKNGYIFMCLCYGISMFLLDVHTSSFMMMVRGYESKGYCAAVVAPMCALMLIRLCKNVEDKSAWRILGITAWASMPIAMSSMAIVPVAVGVVGLTLMICNHTFKKIFIRCLVCVIPNIILMLWYVLGG